MAKMIHMMVRVLDEKASLDFYKAAFNLDIADRYTFDGFSLIYLRNPESDFELELTVNHDRVEPYGHADGYGHIAVVVEDLDQEYRRLESAGLKPVSIIKEFKQDDRLLARFFFLIDPDGYKIEVLERYGRYQ